MVPFLLATVLLAVAAVLVGTTLRRRQAEAEAHADRTLARLRRRQTALAERTADIGREVAALYPGEALSPPTTNDPHR